MDELRANLTRHWRHNLKLAKKNNLEVVEGFTGDLVREFFSPYAETRARKSGGWILPIGYFSQAQREMPEGMKPWFSI